MDPLERVNLDCVDDLALLSHSHHQMKMESVELGKAKQTGLKIHKDKTKVLKTQLANSTIMEIPDKEFFTNTMYLGRKIKYLEERRGVERGTGNIKVRIQKKKQEIHS